jgi:hypothetical protein
LAVKGLIKIIKLGKANKYTIKKLRDANGAEISEEEEIIMQKLFSANSKYTIGSVDDSKIQTLLSKYNSAIKSKMRGQYFVYNRKYSLLGLIISAIGAVISFGKSYYDPEAIFLMMWLSIWSFVCFGMLASALIGWKNIVTKGKGKGITIFLTFFMLPFWAAEIFVLNEVIKLTSFNFTIFLAVSFGIHALFYNLLPRPTILARKILDELEGLELYLTVAEKERYKQFYEADITPETYEKLLPYAIALGVEEKWSERFSSSINASTYQPSWYDGGSSNSFNRGGFSGAAFAGGFAAGLGSALASANTSSSGSGGGGSSGGGGGGGGGGGW